MSIAATSNMQPCPMMSAAGAIVTFQVRPRPTTHNVDRVRENQRRHRARVKTHVAELEARLAETRGRLDAALAEVRRLTAEVEALRGGEITSQSTNSGPTDPTDPTSPPPESRLESPATNISSSDYASHQSSALLRPTRLEDPEALDILPTALESVSTDTARRIATSSPQAQSQSATTRGPAIHTQGQQIMISEVDTAQYDALLFLLPPKVCDNLPVPQSGESTMACRDAYRVIEEQNRSGLGVDDFIDWLKPGFRRALTQGGGRRVNTQLLFALLDHVSSDNGDEPPGLAVSG
jgi:hypothetical protein